MWRVVAIMGVIMALMITTGGFYFKWSQSKMDKLNQKMAEQEITIQSQQVAMEELTARIQTVQKLQKNYNNNVNQIRSDTDKMQGEVSHITDNANSQPRDTEKVINTFTNQMFREYETISRGDNLKPAAPAPAQKAAPAKKGK